MRSKEVSIPSEGFGPGVTELLGWGSRNSKIQVMGGRVWFLKKCAERRMGGPTARGVFKLERGKRGGPSIEKGDKITEVKYEQHQII